MHMPVPTIETLRNVAAEFETKCNFPHCIGTIDGKHIRIKRPPNTGSQYFNYKHFFSVHLQAVADANCKFITIDVGDDGRRNDSGVFVNTSLYHHLENNSFNTPPPESLPATNFNMPYVLLGDQGYPLKPYLMRPYSSNMDAAKETINYLLSSARMTVERAFGILELNGDPIYSYIISITYITIELFVTGDAGYPSEPWLIRPHRNPGRGSEEASFNTLLSSGRIIVEMTIAILKSRFRCLNGGDGCLNYTPKKCAAIINVCRALHNVCIEHNIEGQQVFDDIMLSAQAT
ncbi:uncharacterized protein LOC125769466 [Anopheles funestus]|uniref:uncharacterized protein LOC125769466 n=1 Tax=Anopheles funestus TaxID=62324 RepID=UPI0020C61D74|nr:uncharacterized protein LOC125769466 [Anopheles funestus]